MLLCHVTPLSCRWNQASCQQQSPDVSDVSDRQAQQAQQAQGCWSQPVEVQEEHDGTGTCGSALSPQAAGSAWFGAAQGDLDAG